jgi:histidinol dehydrogenase
MNVREIAELTPDQRRRAFERSTGVESVREDAREIVNRVREEGDVAVRALTSEHDGVEPGNMDVTAETARAYDRIDDDLAAAIDRTADNVREFHEEQLPDDWLHDFGGGRRLGRRFAPLESVGVYVPGGRAGYPSSGIMGVVPGTVAGVEHVAVATPPAPDGGTNDATLAAIYAAGADTVYSVGGAQAIAALAYGTETVAPVQKVVGPGNNWVTAAKAEVRGDVAIDMLAGPSEILVLCDETADPELVAADVLAQAEHDPDAVAAVVTDDRNVAEAVVEAVERQVENRDRADVICEALDDEPSGVFLARSTSEAILFAEEFAPEHLSIQADDEETILSRISNAGSVFLGADTPVAAGDYATGTNHVLPTGGSARLTSGLSVDDFLRSRTVQKLSGDALADLSETIVTLAEAEGLGAHAESVRRRVERDRDRDRSSRGGEKGG